MIVIVVHELSYTLYLDLYLYTSIAYWVVSMVLHETAAEWCISLSIYMKINIKHLGLTVTLSPRRCLWFDFELI